MSTHPSKSFDPEVETVEEFLQRFQLQNAVDFAADEGADGMKKAMLLANSLPISIVTDIQRRLKPVLLTKATYKQIEQQLVQSYSVKKSVIGAAVSFVTRKQKLHESIETYSKVLNELASQCDYKVCCRDRMLRDIFVSGLKSTKVVSTLITECENKNFQECIQRAKVLEQVSIDIEDIHPAVKIHNTYNIEKKSGHSSNNNYNKKNSYSTKKVPNNYVCIRCGTKASHFADKCFAMKKTCNKCNRTGHLSKVCKSGHRNGTTADSHYLAPEEVDQSDYITINHIENAAIDSNNGMLATGNNPFLDQNSLELIKDH